MTRIYLCAQCAKEVLWPKSMKPSEDQPAEKQKCQLCKRLCYGTLYDMKEEGSNARL